MIFTCDEMIPIMTTKYTHGSRFWNDWILNKNSIRDLSENCYDRYLKEKITEEYKSVQIHNYRNDNSLSMVYIKFTNPEEEIHFRMKYCI